MNYSIRPLPFFEKQLKRLIKKYPSLKKEYADLIDQLVEAPDLGTPIGNNCYKIRVAIASKGRGKSGGARVITFLKVVESVVYLLSIYDKSEQSDISDKELEELTNEVD